MSSLFHTSYFLNTNEKFKYKSRGCITSRKTAKDVITHPVMYVFVTMGIFLYQSSNGAAIV